MLLCFVFPVNAIGYLLEFERTGEGAGMLRSPCSAPGLLQLTELNQPSTPGPADPPSHQTNQRPGLEVLVQGKCESTDPTLGLDNPPGEEVFPNVQPKRCKQLVSDAALQSAPIQGLIPES